MTDLSTSNINKCILRVKQQQQQQQQQQQHINNNNNNNNNNSNDKHQLKQKKHDLDTTKSSRFPSNTGSTESDITRSFIQFSYWVGETSDNLEGNEWKNRM